jgi:hypothetical protein
VAQAPLPDQACKDAWTVFEACGFSLATAARRAKIPRATLENRIEEAKRRFGYSKDSLPALQNRVRALERELKQSQAGRLDSEVIRSTILGLKAAVDETEPPDWTLDERKSDEAPGVPTLLLSDFHWGEVVKAPQIMNKNRYNLTIAHARLKAVVSSAIGLLKIISPKLDYPGIVVPLGGDMISGNIHDELQATNEINTMPTVLDLYGELIGVITTLADTFGQVFLPCVTGNHGRDTQKIWHKDRTHTSFDWLLYCFLAKHFEKDKRITFLIPDGPDAYFRIYSHRYLLTHGDQFRGGDGMIGALGPIIRGDHKKRSRNAQIDMEYDTMAIGHWHQDIFLRRLIVNSSLKGYDEYAFNNNFPFEVPSQQLWLTHQRHRITFRMPVYAERAQREERTPWVAVAA